MRNGDPKRPGFLYFISSETQKAVKIGFAEEVYMRLKSLQTGNPDELVLLAAVPCLAEAELLLHRAMKHKRIRLEWYPDDDEIQSMICELQDDMFDAGLEVVDFPEGISLQDASELLVEAYKATPLPTELILARARECCLESDYQSDGTR